MKSVALIISLIITVISLITTACNQPLPTEPIPNPASSRPILATCEVVRANPANIDFGYLPDGTHVYTRVAYDVVPSEWQVYVSDGHCGPSGNGWEVNVVKNGKLELIGW